MSDTCAKSRRFVNIPWGSRGLRSATQIIIAELVLAACCAGCLNPINAKTADRYYQAGIRAEELGDLTLARKDFSRAYWNAQVGNLGPVGEASTLYEWARITGYLGMYEDAGRGFTNTLNLIDKANGKAEKWRAPALCELARMLHDTNQHKKAVPVFERAVEELDRRDAQKGDPIGFAEFLDDYAESLKNADLNERADEIARRSVAIKQQNQGMAPKLRPRRYSQ